MIDVVVHNTCSPERIDPLFVPLVEAVRDGMVRCCGDWLREVRLQGSIARGDARPGKADLDMIAILDGPPSRHVGQCLEDLAARIGDQNELVSQLDLEALESSHLGEFQRFVLSSDSLCVFGTDSLTLPAQSMERMALVRLVTPDPTNMIPDYLGWIEELPTSDDAERRFASRIIGKDLLKVMRGVHLLRGGAYHVAIAEIASGLPETTLEADGVVRQLYALYDRPTTDVDVIRRAAWSAAQFLRGCPEFAFLGS
jgi:predicted nucleotidyltransferase